MQEAFLRRIIKQIFLTDSPSGYSLKVNEVVTNILAEIGYKAEVLNKNTILVKIEGKSHDKIVATSAHLDTLGLMVRSINSDGTLRVTNVGGPIAPTLDGEYCKVQTRFNKAYSGTILSTSPSAFTDLPNSAILVPSIPYCLTLISSKSFLDNDIALWIRFKNILLSFLL